MIINRDTHIHAACFDEINHAVECMTDRTVWFNAHTDHPDAFSPDGDPVVYNLENVGTQVGRHTYPCDVELWDFSARNCERWRDMGRQVTHVPIGYHPSMGRFTPLPWSERDIDVILCGAMNERRKRVVEDMRARGVHVVHNPGVYGVERDKLLARSKLCLNMLFYEDGVFPALRAAHCVANRVPMLTEDAPEMWGFLDTAHVDNLIDRAETYLLFPEQTEQYVDWVYEEFKSMPMKLP